ncbi:hypothetical protein CEXT_717241 [Caerostris extrusa]|uniref:Uncharacterized protein n=1 Tax=Caerostris extrusa TaxID=172846 RepID=A0AAV4XW90_CAEEX|nr:hypothetical protein CEXT_717241 [Caerostris extrusa]
MQSRISENLKDLGKLGRLREKDKRKYGRQKKGKRKLITLSNAKGKIKFDSLMKEVKRKSDSLMKEVKRTSERFKKPDSLRNKGKTKSGRQKKKGKRKFCKP